MMSPKAAGRVFAALSQRQIGPSRVLTRKTPGSPVSGKIKPLEVRRHTHGPFKGCLPPLT